MNLMFKYCKKKMITKPIICIFLSFADIKHIHYLVFLCVIYPIIKIINVQKDFENNLISIIHCVRINRNKNLISTFRPGFLNACKPA